MNEKSQKLVPAPLLVGVEPNPGPGRGSKWNEEQRWRTIFKWKDEKKGTKTIANEMGVSRSAVQILKSESLAKKRDTLQNSMFGEELVTILKQIYTFSARI